MAIPGPGPTISLQTIVDEFGGTIPHSLSEYYRGGGKVPDNPSNSAIAASGAITLGSFYGSQNILDIILNITSPVNNYNVYNAAVSAGYVAGSPVTVNVSPGVVVGSASLPASSMLVPSQFNAADPVTIVNNGTIIGRGGTGGRGGYTGPTQVRRVATNGLKGGTAINLQRPTTIQNNGNLYGGGGGGGGGRSDAEYGPNFDGGWETTYAGGGGGGGAHFGAGGTQGWPANVGTAPSTNGGATGTITGGGAGGLGEDVPSALHQGGPGGGVGAAGTTRNPAPAVIGGAGGAGGHYIVGNPFATFSATGTRIGTVA